MTRAWKAMLVSYERSLQRAGKSTTTVRRCVLEAEKFIDSLAPARTPARTTVDDVAEYQARLLAQAERRFKVVLRFVAHIGKHAGRR